MKQASYNANIYIYSIWSQTITELIWETEFMQPALWYKDLGLVEYSKLQKKGNFLVQNAKGQQLQWEFKFNLMGTKI